eukprot:jgi/Chlat1/5506/Chrsp360S00836
MDTSPAMRRALVLDNGACAIKAGFTGDNATAESLATSLPKVLCPNAVGRMRGDKKWLAADLLDDASDLAQIAIKRPFDRGYLVNWDVQREVWDRVFSQLLKVRASDTPLLVTEPLFNLRSIQENMDEIVFEQYGFPTCLRATGPLLSHYLVARTLPECMLAQTGCSVIVDAGFSFTHVAPIIDGAVYLKGVRRQALTNYLKELVSYRQWNMMDESWILEDVKEKLCFSSLDLQRDLNIARKPGADNIYRKEYVLPDGVKFLRGFVRDPLTEAEKRLLRKQQMESLRSEPASRKNNAPPEEQAILLANERFSVPEVLFNPLDIGIEQAGLAETIVLAVEATPPAFHGPLYSSIVLTGGTTQLPNFKERLYQDLRPLVYSDYDVDVLHPPEPHLTSWRGGLLFANSSLYEKQAMTRVQYFENGVRRAHRR